MNGEHVSHRIRPAANGWLSIVRGFWQWLRELSGDSAYQRYAACQLRDGSPLLLSEREFYLDRIDRRYSSINRCC
jgi:uncharacterized short protein YbdD (DUF466 family)